MIESELYKDLGLLTKDKDRWKECIPYVSSLLAHNSVKIQAKALWLLGEMGFVYPQSVQEAIPVIASFLDRKHWTLPINISFHRSVLRNIGITMQRALRSTRSLLTPLAS